MITEKHTTSLQSELKWPTLRPRSIWYTRNWTWSSLSFWVFTMLFRSAPIRCVTRYLQWRDRWEHKRPSQSRVSWTTTPFTGMLQQNHSSVTPLA